MNSNDRAIIAGTIYQIKEINNYLVRLQRCKDKEYVVDEIMECKSKFVSLKLDIEDISQGEYEKYENISNSSFGDYSYTNDDRAQKFYDAYKAIEPVIELFDESLFDELIANIKNGIECEYSINFDGLLEGLDGIKDLKTGR